MVVAGVAVSNLEPDGQPGFAVVTSRSNFLIKTLCVHILCAPGLNGEDPR